MLSRVLCMLLELVLRTTFVNVARKSAKTHGCKDVKGKPYQGVYHNEPDRRKRSLSRETPPQEDRRPRGQESRPGAQGKRLQTSKTNTNSGSLPRPEGDRYQSSYRTYHSEHDTKICYGNRRPWPRMEGPELRSIGLPLLQCGI